MEIYKWENTLQYQLHVLFVVIVLVVLVTVRDRNVRNL